jgi:Raf kinase inhibitor-like YbhB/YbcL family protein
MTITSGEFTNNIMPARFTCSAPHAPTPPLGWAGWPPGTKSIALVVDDSNAPITPYVYWIVFNISSATSDILEGQLPPGARQARNSAGIAGYEPPCPGSAGHTYRFTVYALKSRIDLPDGAPLQSVWRAIAAAAIGRGRMTASAHPAPSPATGVTSPA